MLQVSQHPDIETSHASTTKKLYDTAHKAF